MFARLLLIPAIVALLLLYLSYPVTTFVADKPIVPQTKGQFGAVVMHESAVSMGLISEHRSRSYRLNSIVDNYGNGVCVLDFNQDGFEDIFIVQGAGTTRRYGREHWWQDNQASSLFQNHQGRYFTGVKLPAEVKGFGCTVGDINHDDKLDILVGDIGKLHVLSGNNSGEHDFNYQQLSLNERDWPTSLLIDDVNNDGLNDIIVATMVEYRNDIKVGDQLYGYQGRPSINTSDYDGQNNHIFINQAKEQVAGQQQRENQFTRHTLTGQQRTLSILNAGNGQFLAVNAKGSNSVMQGVGESLQTSAYDWLNFPAVQISPIGDGDFLVTNHGSRGIQLINQQSRLNQAWVRGLSNDVIDNSQSWATLVADFNNDGREDVMLASGYASEAINTPTRTQGSVNHLILQQDNREFTTDSARFNPKLSRSSRGASYGDFNNDGLLDVVVVNNNQFNSLYINDSINVNHWVSFDCIPLSLCQSSQWQLGVQTKLFDKQQPYLSSVSARIHFALTNTQKSKQARKKDPKQQTLTVNGSVFTLPKLNQHYRLNLHLASLTAIDVDDIELIANAEQLFLELVNTNKPPQQIMAKADKRVAAQLLHLIKRWQQQMGDKLTTTDKRLTVATAWLVRQIQPLSKDLIDVLIAAENRIFIDSLIAAIDELNEDNFCYLADKLDYWFDQEEILPETKLALLPKLMKIALTASSNRQICAIEALAYSEQTTIGASLLPLLDSNKPLLSAAVIRALGRLKFARGQPQLKRFCTGLDGSQPVMRAECDISQLKLQGFSGKPIDSPRQKSLFALHSEQLLLDEQFKHSGDLGAFSRYVSSPISDHRYMAYLSYLQQSRATLIADKPDLTEFAVRARKHFQQDVDKLLRFALNKPPLVKYASNQQLTHLFEIVKNNRGKKLAKALISECILRPSLAKVCQRYFGHVNSDIKQLNISYFNQLLPAQQYYLLSQSSAVRQKILVRQLYLANDVEYLSFNRSYLHLTTVEAQWLAAFLRHCFTQGIKIDKAWLGQVSKDIEFNQPLEQWLKLYQVD